MSNKQRVLIIGHVWPEPNSTAAGTRILQLIRIMIAEDWEIYFTSAAQKSEFSAPLHALGVSEKSCYLNDVNFQSLVKEINPSVVVYDRFLTEEQFGWRVREVAQKSLQVLDTEDLHFLRKAREESVKQGKHANEAYLYTDLAKREIGAMLRCDLNLIISEVEMQLLQFNFQFSKSQLFYLPFLVDTSATNEQTSFLHRKHFVSIGNFLHAPNWDQVRYLKTHIWPELKRQLPEATLHVYGAYTSDKVQQLHHPKDRFLVKGRAENALETLKNYRLLLAPLRFGAGLKGKIMDAFLAGTPVVTSTIGAEGMTGNQEWPGAIEDEAQRFIAKATALYQNQEKWEAAHAQCRPLLTSKFGLTNFAHIFVEKLTSILENLNQHREKHFFSQVLSQHQVNAQKFMSLWIEEKNKFTRK